MPTTTAQSIIDAAAFTLQDEASAQWTRAELLIYLNDGQRDACIVKPDVYTLNAAVQLVAGTKQALPAGSNGFVRIARNMGAAGTTPGRVPRQVLLATLDLQSPNWHSEAASATVMEYLYDERDPKIFYVSPPQPVSGMGYVDLVHYGVPAALANEAAVIGLDDVLKTALMHYVVYRAYLKEGEFSNMAGAAAHRAEFLSLLGAKEKAEGTDKAGA
jgi:hypothetical protein